MPLTDNPLNAYRGALDAFPLRFGVSSFVWPASYIENVTRLKGIFAEVQLLSYESQEKSPISDDELRQLAALKDGAFSYSLHLPGPSGLTAPGGNGEAAIIKAMEAFAPVGVGNYVLHLEQNGRHDLPLAAKRLERILKTTGVAPEHICVENTIGTPFPPVWDAVKGLGVSICFDIGHHMYEKGNPLAFIDSYGGRIRMCHIHGVADRDHRPLSAMPEETLASVLSAVADCRLAGSVIIENFSVADVAESVRCLVHGANRFFPAPVRA